MLIGNTDIVDDIISYIQISVVLKSFCEIMFMTCDK